MTEMLSSTLLRLVLAASLGGAIGLERELSHKPAGLRTNMFICFGAAFYTILSVELAGEFVGDHTRIAAQIIPGIGFIGAGSILHARGGVSGLTTAATLFVVASIGMAAGAGLSLPAIFATILILVALQSLGWFETRFNLKPLHMTYEAAGEAAEEMTSEINRIAEEAHHIIESVHVMHSNGGYLVRFTVDATYREHTSILARMRRSPIFQRIAFAGERE
jgi:putative Mg2+ transporter-C (MgtC) family protein